MKKVILGLSALCMIAFTSCKDDASSKVNSANVAQAAEHRASHRILLGVCSRFSRSPIRSAHDVRSGLHDGQTLQPQALHIKGD